MKLSYLKIYESFHMIKYYISYYLFKAVLNYFQCFQKPNFFQSYVSILLKWTYFNDSILIKQK